VVAFVAFVILSLCPVPAFPQSIPEDPPYETRVHGSTVQDEGTTIDEVRSDEIDRMGARTAADAIRSLPSVYVSTDTRGDSVYTIRGFDSRQTALLIDGSPAVLPFDGRLDLGLVPAEILDHVTIVKGPASVLYGPNGLGGAVNLVTRKPGTGPVLELTTEGAAGQAARLSGYHSARAGPAAWSVFGGLDRREAWPLSARFTPGRLEDGGWRTNSDLALAHAGATVRLDASDDHEILGSVLYLDGSRGVPPSTEDPVPRFWRFGLWRAFAGSGGHTGRYGAVEVDETAFVRIFRNDLDGFDDATYTSQASLRGFHSEYRDWTAGGRIRGRLLLPRAPWGPTIVRLWTAVQHDRHRHDPGSGQPETLASRTLVTGVPEVVASLSSWWTASAACAFDAEFPGSFSGAPSSPKLGVGPLLSGRFEPASGLSFTLTAARRIRFPTLKERFAEGFGTRVPNPALGPESAWHFALDASWQAADWLRVEGGVFDAEVAGLIERVYLGDGKDQLRNRGSARMTGAELSLEVRPARWLRAEAGYAWLRARGSNGDPLEYRPDHRFFTGMVATPLPWIALSAQVQATGSRAFTNPVTLVPGRLDPFAVLDARLDVRPAEFLDLWVRAANLLDSDHAGEFGFPEPGRQVWAGVRVRPVTAPRASPQPP
jgi:iron complex outermembrane receptor protein